MTTIKAGSCRTYLCNNHETYINETFNRIRKAACEGDTVLRYPERYGYKPMTPLAEYASKVGISALLIVAIAEIAKRSTGFVAVVASLRSLLC